MTSAPQVVDAGETQDPVLFCTDAIKTLLLNQNDQRNDVDLKGHGGGQAKAAKGKKTKSKSNRIVDDEEEQKMLTRLHNRSALGSRSKARRYRDLWGQMTG